MLTALFTTFIYQPFFNILVFFYWVLGVLTGGQPDMGIAVILLTVLIRLLLLPITLMGDRSEEDRRKIAHQAKELEETLAHDPVLLRQEMKKLFRSKPTVIVGELVSLTIQVAIALMLWRIFATGLEGADFHLLYPFMPKVELPFNLLFLGTFDLAHSSLFLNFLQSFLIFVLETLAIYTSPYPPAKGEVVRLQLVMPVVAFFIFMLLPAGKKLFVITTLSISIIITFIKFIRRKLDQYQQKLEAKQAEVEATVGHPENEKIVVDIK